MGSGRSSFPRDLQYIKFSLYGALKNLKFFEPFIMLYFREVGFSFFQIGTLFAVREIATNIFEIPTGVVADSYGRRNSMVFSFAAYILSFLVFTFVPRYSFALAAMVFFALGEAFRTGTHKAMILEYLRIRGLLDHRVDYYGHTRGWSQFGSAVSSLLAAALVFYSGSYRIIFVASTIPYILDMLLIISYPKELDGEHAAPDRTVTLAKRTGRQLFDTLKSFREMFRNPAAFKAILNGAVFDAVFKTVKYYLQPILKKYAILIPLFVSLGQERRTAILIGVVYSVLYLLTSAASRRSGSFSKRFSLTRSLNVTFLTGTGFILAAAGSLLMGWYIPAIVIFILLYIVENLKRPMNVGYFSQLISSNVMATGLSVESQVTTILMAVLAPVMGFFADSFGVAWGLGFLALLLVLSFPAAHLRAVVRTETE